MKSSLDSHETCPTCGRQTAARTKCVYCSTVTDLDVKSLQFEDFSTNDAIDNISDLPDSFSLVNSKNNTRFKINQNKIKIGRDPSNQISISDDTFTSRHHAWITFENGKFYLEDLSSTNGTFLNGHPVHSRQEINAGDRIRVGHTEFTFLQNDSEF